MNPILTAYQKLYSEILPNDFPVIDSIEVKPKEVPEDLIGRIFEVNVYLKTKDNGKGRISWKPFMNKLKRRMIELNSYLGARPLVDINLYYEGEIIASGVLTL